MSSQPRFSILATSFAGGPRPRNAALILGGLWLLLFFAALFAPPLLDDADATHAEAARSMLTSGDWVTLHVDGVRYLEKAPLPYWLAAISMAVFGANTFAAHLPQALAVLLLMLLGHRWANGAFGSRTAFYTAAGILTSVGVFLFTRILIPEALLALTLGAAVYAFQKILVVHPSRAPQGEMFQRSEAGGSQALVPEQPALTFYAGPNVYPYLMWTALALAVLTKGLVALVFFCATTLLYLLLVGELFSLETWRRLRPFTGLLLFVALAAPWHVLAAIRNPAPPGGHGFVWFYFWNEHVLRFLGRREPRDYNKLPAYLYWLQHLVWLFPWTLFLPLGMAALWRRLRHQDAVLTGSLGRPLSTNVFVLALVTLMLLSTAVPRLDSRYGEAMLLGVLGWICLQLLNRRRRVGLPPSPFHRIDPQQRTILLLSLFAAVVLLFFSLSTNQEYYTFPAYLPILLLIAATVTRAEQNYSHSPESRRWITFAHAAFVLIGAAIACGLLYGLFASRHLPFVPDIGDLLAHRGLGGYTLATSHVFDLTAASFAALRLPATLAALALALGPALAWALRTQRRHLAATTAIAFTSAAFLFAAHLALVRFAPMLSSEDLAARIEELEDDHRISRTHRVMLFGDQAYGSSIPFYLNEPVELVDGRSTSMLFGSTFPDAQSIFLTHEDLLQEWSEGERKIVFIPAERRDDFDGILPPSRQIVLEETSGKALITDRPLDPP